MPKDFAELLLKMLIIDEKNRINFEYIFQYIRQQDAPVILRKTENAKKNAEEIEQNDDAIIDEMIQENEHLVNNKYVRDFPAMIKRPVIL